MSNRHRALNQRGSKPQAVVAVPTATHALASLEVGGPYEFPTNQGSSGNSIEGVFFSVDEVMDRSSHNISSNLVDLQSALCNSLVPIDEGEVASGSADEEALSKSPQNISSNHVDFHSALCTSLIPIDDEVVSGSADEEALSKSFHNISSDFLELHSALSTSLASIDKDEKSTQHKDAGLTSRSVEEEAPKKPPHNTSLVPVGLRSTLFTSLISIHEDEVASGSVEEEAPNKSPHNIFSVPVNLHSTLSTSPGPVDKDEESTQNRDAGLESGSVEEEAPNNSPHNIFSVPVNLHSTLSTSPGPVDKDEESTQNRDAGLESGSVEEEAPNNSPHNISPDPVALHSALSTLPVPIDKDEESTQNQDAGLDSGSVEEVEMAPRKGENHKRLQNVQFQDWFAKRAESIAKEEDEKAQGIVDDGTHSRTFLVAKKESDVIITDPREYQVELYERAKARNTIAVLDTGSGKTLIAVLLLRHILDQELEDRAAGKAPKVAFFLVDSVTLLFQQYAVLDCNLDQKIDRFCGEMGSKLWSKETWDRHFHDNMVIVCTADVLHQCLLHSFITIERISILIFDEAHHAKKKHAYAKIMWDFYHKERDPCKLPRVFGMTASPVDVRKYSISDAASELEEILDSQIATTSDLSLLRHNLQRPVEEHNFYCRDPTRSKSSLYQEVRALVTSDTVLADVFRHAAEATSELGPWCADQLWALLVAEKDGQKTEARLEQELSIKGQYEFYPGDPKAELQSLQDALDHVKRHVFDEPRIDEAHLSSKVLQLHKRLEDAFSQPSDNKCIVFVQQRYTARVLAALFGRGCLPHLRVGTLLGARKGRDPSDLSVSYRKQIITMLQFRNGALNCLFATSVAEEGLDIPDCNLVIRFDLYTTMIQYVQSRGRARRKGSAYVHMLEAQNFTHLRALQDVQVSEEKLRNFCMMLPEERRLLGNEHDAGVSLIDDSDEVFVVPETGAKLTYDSSLAVLAHFTSCLPNQVEGGDKPTYVMSVHYQQFICEVVLPESSPLKSMIGKVCSRKATAKRSAAFEACLYLIRGKYLDNHLLPIYTKSAPKMRNAQLALNLKNTQAYDMRLKPSVWAESLGMVSNNVYLTVLHLAAPIPSKPYQPLGIVTRFAFPEFPRFRLHLTGDHSSEVICTTLKRPLELQKGRLDAINTFTLRVFKDLFNKLFESDLGKTPYWLVPISLSKPIASDSGVDDLIDWRTVELVQEHESLPWDWTISDDFFADKFLVDPFDGGRRYFTVAVHPTLKPLDPVPSDAPPRKHMDNILSYSVSLFKKSRARAQFRESQPVIIAHRVLHRQNWLDKLTEDEAAERTQCYICAEPLYVSALPTGIAAMGLMFPAIIFRLDSYLIAREQLDILELDVPLDLALEALTKDTDNRETSQGEQIQFERGMGNNYERLELLGDCFLKMATSIALYTLESDSDEFEYHVLRMLMICNKNLLQSVRRLNIQEFIRSKGFSRRTWYPEGLKLLQGKGVNKPHAKHTHLLSDKSMADVGEAIIGAALLSGNKKRDFDPAVKAVSLMVDKKHHTMERWSDYYALYQKPAYQTAEASKSHLDLVEQIFAKHDYRFNHPRLLRSAFIHPSYPFIWEKIPNYQRLEFLGDSLLDMACVNYLFYKFGDRDPQWLTEHKMAMVSNKFLGALCVKLGFHKHIRSNGSLVESQIREYVMEVQASEEAARGSPDYWVNMKSPPKALPDVVESYIGAVFVDSGYDYGQVERFFEAHIKPYFEDISIYDDYANSHPTTQLTNLLNLTFKCTNFRIFAQEIAPIFPGASSTILAAVMIHDKVVAEGKASSVKSARVKACLNASAALRNVDLDEYRKKFRCDCSTGTGMDHDHHHHHIPLAKRKEDKDDDDDDDEDDDDDDDDDNDDDDEAEREEKKKKKKKNQVVNANTIEKEDILIDFDLQIVPCQDHHDPKGGKGVKNLMDEEEKEEEPIIMGEEKEALEMKGNEGRKKKEDDPKMEIGGGGGVVDDMQVNSAPPTQSIATVQAVDNNDDDEEGDLISFD